MKFVKLALISCAMVGLLTTYGWADTDSDEIVPSSAMSAKDVASKLKDQGATNIRHLEYDDNQWNAKTQHGQKEITHKIDAKTGDVTGKSEENEYESAPPSNVLGILEVINVVRSHGVDGIREVEYDDSLWKVEAVKDGKLVKLCLDPIAGDVIWSDSKKLDTKEGKDKEDKASTLKSKLKDAMHSGRQTFKDVKSKLDAKATDTDNQYQYDQD